MTELERLKIRLAKTVTDQVTELGWTQTDAAKRLGITRPRLSDLQRGLLEKFSLDALVKIAAKLNIRLTITTDD